MTAGVSWPKTVRCLNGCGIEFQVEAKDVWHGFVAKPIGAAEHLVCKCPSCGFARNFERYDPEIHKNIPTRKEWSRTQRVEIRL